MPSSRSKPVSDEWLAMTPDERLAELRRGRVDDPSQLTPEDQERHEAVLAEARRHVDENPPPPLRVVDNRHRQTPTV